MYYVVITPKRGPQYRLPDRYNSLGSAIQAANVEAAANATLVDVAVWEMTATGGWVIPWERNLHDERARTAAEMERDTAIDLADAMDAGLPVDAWNGVAW